MYQIIEPTEKLKPFIESYWVVQPKNEESVQLRVDVYPDARADLIFNYGAPYFRTTLEGSSEHQDSNLDAQRTYPIVIHQQGLVKIVGVRFQLGGIGAFVSKPLARFTDLTLELEDVWPGDGEQLESELEHLVPDLGAVGRRLDLFFLSHLNETEEFQEFRALLQQVTTNQTPRFNWSLGNTNGMSKRTISRRFAKYIGLTVNTVQQISRFQRALQYLMTGPEGSLVEISSDCGYYDQSHFIRDFKKFAGGIPGEFRHYFPECAPRDFAPNLVQFVQDEES